MQGKQAVNIPEIRNFEAVSYKHSAFAPQAICRGAGPCRLDFNKPQEPTLEQKGEPGSSLLQFSWNHDILLYMVFDKISEF